MFYCLSDGEYIDISKADGNILSQRGFPHIKQLIMKNRQIQSENPLNGGYNTIKQMLSNAIKTTL